MASGLWGASQPLGNQLSLTLLEASGWGPTSVKEPKLWTGSTKTGGAVSGFPPPQAFSDCPGHFASQGLVAWGSRRETGTLGSCHGAAAAPLWAGGPAEWL